MALPFSVSDDSVTSFTYDMTVFRTGNIHNAKYILKPQISESGAAQLSREPKDKGNPDKPVVPEQRPTNVPPTGNRPNKK